MPAYILHGIASPWLEQNDPPHPAMSLLGAISTRYTGCEFLALSTALPHTTRRRQRSGEQMTEARAFPDPSRVAGGSARATVLLSFGLVANLATQMTFAAT